MSLILWFFIPDHDNDKADVYVHINSRRKMNEESVPEEEIKASCSTPIEIREGAWYNEVMIFIVICVLYNINNRSVAYNYIIN